MRSPLSSCGALAATLVLAACSATGTHDDLSLPETTPRLGDGWIAAVHFGGLDALLPDARDAGLRHAIESVDDRLLELAAQNGAGAPPRPAVELACELLSAPWTLFLGVADDPGVTQPAFRALLVVHGADADAADAWTQRLRSLLATFGLPSHEADSDPDLNAVALPPGDLVYGAHPDDPDLVFAWGPVGALPEGFGPALPAGVEPAVVLELEVGRMLEAVGAREHEHDDPVLALLGDAVSHLGVSLSVGHAGNGAVVRVRYRSWARLMDALELLDRGALGPATLEAIPGDATVVNLARWSADGMVKLLEKAEAASGKEVLGEIEKTLGMPLEELVEPFGGTFGYYLSDTTGGGGLTSAVALASIDDAARMNGVLARLAERLGQVLPGGEARVRSFAHGEATCWALDFPGLPIPFEPSLAVAAGHLFAAATPHTLRAALDHAAASEGGLPRHAALRGLPRGTLDGLTSLQMLDTPRLLRDGYGLLGLLTTALENALRSPADPAREPGPVLPTYADLLEGARPTLLLGRLDGDDLVATGEADASLLAQLGAAMTTLPPLLLPGLLTGALSSQELPGPGGPAVAEPFVYELF